MLSDMAAHTPGSRDPTIAAVLSALVPGLGLLYAGRLRAAAMVMAVECVAWAAGWWILLLCVHAWQIAAAGGEASVAAERGWDAVDAARRRSELRLAEPGSS